MIRTSAATRRHSASSHGEQAARSAGAGALSGGAQRTAASTRVALSVSPSAASTLTGESASPARCSAAYNTSPERSPVNTRPVRLPPWAAGARPTISTRGRGEPQPGIGLPQYGSPANDRRLAAGDLLAPQPPVADTPGIPTPRRRVQPASGAAAAIVATCPGVDATAVSAVAGSPGQPVPGGTGESKSAAVRGWARRTGLLCLLGENRSPTGRVRC